MTHVIVLTCVHAALRLGNGNIPDSAFIGLSKADVALQGSDIGTRSNGAGSTVSISGMKSLQTPSESEKKVDKWDKKVHVIVAHDNHTLDWLEKFNCVDVHIWVYSKYPAKEIALPPKLWGCSTTAVIDHLSTDNYAYMYPHHIIANWEQIKKLDPDHTWHAFVQDDVKENQKQTIDKIHDLNRTFVRNGYKYHVAYSDLGSGVRYVTEFPLRPHVKKWMLFALTWMPETYENVYNEALKHRDSGTGLRWETGWQEMFAASTRVLLSRPIDAYKQWIDLLEQGSFTPHASGYGKEASVSAFFRCDRELYVRDVPESCLDPEGAASSAKDGIEALTTDLHCDRALTYDRIEVREKAKGLEALHKDGIFRCLKRVE